MLWVKRTEVPTALVVVKLYKNKKLEKLGRLVVINIT